jgi:hypothetical protein
MASSDSSAIKLSPGNQSPRYSIYKEYGGMQNFMHSYGLKMWNDDDVQEAKAIADEMLKQDAISKAENVNEQASAKSTTGTTTTTTTTSKRKS